MERQSSEVVSDFTEEELKNVRIPVVLRDGSNDGKGRLCLLKVSEICNITTDGRFLLFETRDHIYHTLTTLDDIGSLFAPVFGFSKIDRSNYVQTNLVKCYDSLMRKVYFEEPVTPKSKFATIAEKRLSFIRSLLGKEKDIATEKSWY